ncbi:MAG: family 20 glycosylhydrolase, partial [Ginsengibacter sp.]
MKKILFIFAILLSFSAISQTTINIVPMPVVLKTQAGHFTFSKSTIIVAGPAVKRDAVMLNFYLKKLYGYTLRVKNISTNQIVKNSILLEIVKPAGKKKDEYNLSVQSNGIKIEGVSNKAIFYGIQTLLQLLPADKDSINSASFQIPALTIKDYPRFQYRGMHLDVSRHFFDVTEVKKYIDYLAYHKFNTFHWHLTDDQGWRIEIKKYPLLTSVGGFRNGT